LSDEDDLEETLHLELGQNLFEIHISKVRSLWNHHCWFLCGNE